MKIVHIITRLILGGAQENTLLSCEGQHKLGHQVTLITGPALGPEGQLMDRALAGGYEVCQLDSLRRAIHPWRDGWAYQQLKAKLAELDPDIVHTHSAKAGILGRWAAGSVRQRAAASCCSRVSRLREAQVAACGRPRIVHSIHGLSFHPYQSARLNRLYIALERSAARSTDAYISVAQAMTDQSLAAGIGRPEQYTRVFSGMETGYYLAEPGARANAQLRQELDISSEAVVIVTVARLFHLKGHEYIIESAKTLAKKQPRAVWLFVGDGLLRAELTRRIEQAGLAHRFRFVGLVPPQEVARYLHAGDILLHPSLREGLARTLPQALLCGKPVISFDVDGAREVVTPQTGILVPPVDVAALTAAQDRLIANPLLRQRMGMAGREFCRREFDHTLMVERIERVYNSLIMV